MAQTRNQTVSQLVFVGRDLGLLLMEIVKYFESHPRQEKYLDDMVVIWSNEDSQYVATLYTNDVREG